jgi:hypothetical protein
MTPTQADALYDFITNVTEPFTLDDVITFIRILEPRRDSRLASEVAAMINTRNYAFRLNHRQWVSRRGCFEPVSFVIKPTRLELVNGILIPGHRCVPFANTELYPHEYKFSWQKALIPVTTTEGSPNDFYPFYCIYGEEYAPQFIARDNPDNEAAFNCDPFEDPPEVSIHTLDMRNIYRETSFVPGDQFIVRTLDWKDGLFELEKVKKEQWPQSELYSWLEAAEDGFRESFTMQGPGNSTEEQIAYAYWYGGKRMRDTPAYSLEEFLFEKTDKIDITPYGIEHRFWFAGKEIPDSKGLEGFSAPPDKTVIEEILAHNQVPVSEFVVLSYIRDALYRGETDIDNAISRLIPLPIRTGKYDRELIAEYLSEAMDEIGSQYLYFADQALGPLRQRAGELHTAIISLSGRLQKGEIEFSCLPRHIFIVLSQIQGHVAYLLEDLDTSELPKDDELEAMNNSLDSMIETYEDIKELIDDGLDNFRRNHLSLVSAGPGLSTPNSWWAVQISVSGTDVWRRALVPDTFTLDELHRLVQAALDWTNTAPYRFNFTDGNQNINRLRYDIQIGELCDMGKNELLYEYGTAWTVKLIFHSPYEAGKDEVVRFVTGAGAAPPENIAGPLRFRRILSVLDNGSDTERQDALHELGSGFVPGLFDIEKCNRNLVSTLLVEK